MDTKRMVECFSSVYCRHTFGELGLGMTAIDESDRLDEDSAAVSDLVAGASAEMFTALAKKYGVVPGIAVDWPAVSRKCSAIGDWFLSKGGRLKKVGVIFDASHGNDQAVRCRIGIWPNPEMKGEDIGGLWTPPASV